MGFLTGHKTLEDAEAENQRLDLEISIRQKREILAGLKQNGLSLKSFGGSLSAAWRWLKERKYKQ